MNWSEHTYQLKFCHTPDKSWVGCIIGFDPPRKPEPTIHVPTYYPAFSWGVAHTYTSALFSRENTQNITCSPVDLGMQHPMCHSTKTEEPPKHP